MKNSVSLWRNYYVNGQDIRDILREALQPTEKELEDYEKIPANIVIQIEPIQTELEIEHPGEPKLMEPFERDICPMVSGNHEWPASGGAAQKEKRGMSYETSLYPC